MGSGSYGGGGGGGGGGSGGSGGGGWSLFTSLTFKAGNAIARKASKKKAEEEARRSFAGLNRDYLTAIMCSELVHGTYGELFVLSVEVFQNRSWDGVAKKYGVGANRGCLRDWAATVVSKHSQRGVDQRVQDLTLEALEGFLIRALGDVPERYFEMSGDELITALDREVFKSTSGFFLGRLVLHVLERESESLSIAVESELEDVAQIIADDLVRHFERDFYQRNQVTHIGIMQSLCQNLAWYLKQVGP